MKQDKNVVSRGVGNITFSLATSHQILISICRSPRAHFYVVGMLRFMCVFGISQPSLPTPFYYSLVSISLFMVLSTIFHSIDSPNNSPLSRSVLPVLFLLYLSFQLFI